MDVADVYGIRDVEYGGSTVGFQGAGGKDTRGVYEAGAGNEVGRVGGERRGESGENAGSEWDFGC